MATALKITHRTGLCGTFCSECGKSDSRAFTEFIEYCWYCGAKFEKKEQE